MLAAMLDICYKLQFCPIRDVECRRLIWCHRAFDLRIDIWSAKIRNSGRAKLLAPILARVLNTMRGLEQSARAPGRANRCLCIGVLQSEGTVASCAGTNHRR